MISRTKTSLVSRFLYAVLAAGLCVPSAVAAQETGPEARTVPPDASVEAGSRFLPGGVDYQIGRQDLLEIRVFNMEALNQTVRVSDDGSISLPLIGKLEVAGLTKTDLEKAISDRLEGEFIRSPQVTVFVKEYESRKVAVSGAVKSPGTYEMLGRKTLLEMISMAGGLDQNYGEEIVVFRSLATGTTQRLSIDLEGLVYDADPKLNIALEAGDIIYIPSAKMMRIFVGGAVHMPSLYEIPRNEPVTVLKAITLAGGTTDRAAEKKIQVIRMSPEGERTSFIVNLRKVLRGQAEDPVLQPDDVVMVPKASF